MDAISHIKKVKGFPDLPNPENLSFVPSFDGHRNREGIDLFLSEFVEQTLNRYDVMTVGEPNGVSIEEAEQWVGEQNGYFDMIFQFEHVDLWGEKGAEGLDLPRLKRTLTKWQKGLEGRGWNALFIENHDLPRVVSLWGEDKSYREKSAKALGMMYFFMKGTPFIYQGQEIGMTNVHFEAIEDYRDVASRNYYREQVNAGVDPEEAMACIWKNRRDNTRTPMQWSEAAHAGFSTHEPWIKVNPNYPKINVKEARENPLSVYHFYREMIRMRKEHPALVYGTYDIVAEDHPTVFAYRRQTEKETYLIITNLFGEKTEVVLDQSIDKGKVLLTNEQKKRSLTEPLILNPYEALLIRIYK